MNKQTRALVEAARIALKLLNGLLTDNQLDFKQPDGTTARGQVGKVRAALKPFDRAEAPRLAWTRSGAEGLTARVGDHVYCVCENGNEPERSAIRWLAMCDNEWLGDGEPRQSDAKLLCYRHAQRAAGVAR